MFPYSSPVFSITLHFNSKSRIESKSWGNKLSPWNNISREYNQGDVRYSGLSSLLIYHSYTLYVYLFISCWFISKGGCALWGSQFKGKYLLRWGENLRILFKCIDKIYLSLWACLSSSVFLSFNRQKLTISWIWVVFIPISFLHAKQRLIMRLFLVPWFKNSLFIAMKI